MSPEGSDLIFDHRHNADERTFGARISTRWPEYDHRRSDNQRSPVICLPCASNAKYLLVPLCAHTCVLNAQNSRLLSASGGPLASRWLLLRIQQSPPRWSEAGLQLDRPYRPWMTFGIEWCFRTALPRDVTDEVSEPHMAAHYLFLGTHHVSWGLCTE
jgi:hypothetical protein